MHNFGKKPRKPVITGSQGTSLTGLPESLNLFSAYGTVPTGQVEERSAIWPVIRVKARRILGMAVADKRAKVTPVRKHERSPPRLGKGKPQGRKEPEKRP
jgi:hypothetical protein